MYYEECFDSPHYESATLYVPASAVDSYRNAPVWKKFVHINGDAGGEAMAFDLEADGIYYVLNKKDATATVVNYSNSNVFIYGTPQYSGDIVIPEAVTDESGKNYAVTAIGNYAFSGCSDLSSVSLPNSRKTVAGFCSPQFDCHTRVACILLVQGAFKSINTQIGYHGGRKLF